MKRVKTIMIFVLLSLSFAVVAETEAPIEIEVYRSPKCGCCSKWIAHLEDNNFKVKDFVSNDVQTKKDEVGVPENMASCHTALVNGYVIEGHVPAVDIRKLLKLKPAVIGISVPGMPSGTPGMEMGGKKDPYNVVSFDKDKNYKVFSSYQGQE
ncbi:MAG: DUF411 domain-containing protein [Methylococcales bacterium]|jgi:hypothetical protein|nr:DUF411 domain-containing protein [Methylococcaceae bacterium]